MIHLTLKNVPLLEFANYGFSLQQLPVERNDAINTKF